jgi:hypothetical protein
MAHAVSLAVPGESLGLDREPLGTVCAVSPRCVRLPL